ncbi:MAG: hypothetical protein HOW73_11985 [Polyangiaceae bacterium]|nr:hypothetical protein [Polyangiaceae bacterium]
MASVFGLLLDTMPFVLGARRAMQEAGTPSLTRLAAADLHDCIQAIDKTADYHPAAPRLPDDPSAPFVQWRLWRFRHQGAQPDKISGVTCRVRETGYKTQRVLEQVEFGYAGESPDHADPFRNVIKVVRPAEGSGSDTTLELPLSQEYVHSKWSIGLGHTAEGSHPWYPLQATLDRALVVAFAYEIGPSGLVPYQAPADDVGEQALQQYLAGPDSCADSPSDRWIVRATRGSFMPAGDGVSARAAVGGSASVVVTYPRILVAIAFSTMRERPDFEPGGIVGMARMYPHVMVTASVPLRSIHAAVKLTRPTRTTALDEGDGTRPGGCCNAHDEIRALLVADTNGQFDAVPDLAGFPFWSGLFAYNEINPERRLPNHVLRVVRRDKPTERIVADCGRRNIPDVPYLLESNSIRKMPRQGEFDNIHVAPRLRIPSTVLIDVAAGAPRTDIDPALMQLDPIVMAPFCAHDCFHMHWRWGTSPNMVTGSYRWTLGWGSGSWAPYAEDGKPLTPPNHDVDLVVHSSHSFTYREHAYPTPVPEEDADHTIAANTWHIFAYPGTAYAQGLFEWRSEVTSLMQFGDSIMNGVMTQLRSYSFANARGDAMSTLNTPAVLYWNLRYYPEAGADGRLWAREWLEMTEEECDRARWR